MDGCEERVLLPAVLAPRVAIALFTQQTFRDDAPVPNFFEARGTTKVTRAQRAAEDPSCVTFATLHAAYLALRVPTVFTSAGAASDYVQADTAELFSKGSEDGSHPPRAVSVMLLFASPQSQHSVGWNALDSLAMLARGGLAKFARLGVAAAEDARSVAKELGVALGGQTMVVRVARGEGADASAGAVATTLVDLDDMPTDRLEAACWVLDKLTDALPAHLAVPALVNSRPTKKPDTTEACFGAAWAAASEEFCALAVAKPEVTRRAFGEDSLPALVFAKDFVRLCPRNAPVNHGDVLHGLLLCASGAEEETTPFVSENLEGLRPPRNEAKNRRLDLHVAVLNWCLVELGADVSLFGQRNVPGRVRTVHSNCTKLKYQHQKVIPCPVRAGVGLRCPRGP